MNKIKSIIPVLVICLWSNFLFAGFGVKIGPVKIRHHNNGKPLTNLTGPGAAGLLFGPSAGTLWGTKTAYDSHVERKKFVEATKEQAKSNKSLLLEEISNKILTKLQTELNKSIKPSTSFCLTYVFWDWGKYVFNPNHLIAPVNQKLFNSIQSEINHGIERFGDEDYAFLAESFQNMILKTAATYFSQNTLGREFIIQETTGSIIFLENFEINISICKSPQYHQYIIDEFGADPDADPNANLDDDDMEFINFNKATETNKTNLINRIAYLRMAKFYAK